VSDFVAKLRARTRPEICDCAIGIHLADGSEPDEDCVKAADTITRLTVDNERLRAALKVAHKYVLVQSCELSLMPEDAARDLAIIDEALEEGCND
jgi:hypothetical protein